MTTNTDAISLLREIAALKRYHPNAIRGLKKSTLTLNVPYELLDRIDAVLAAAPAANVAQDYCSIYCKKICQNSVHGVCDGPPIANVAQDDRAVLEEAAVLCFEMSQKYPMETMAALQEAAGIIRTRLRKGSLKVALEYIEHGHLDTVPATPPAQAANVAQGAKLSDEQIVALRIAADALIEKYAKPIRDILKNVEHAPPAQTALAADARDAARYRDALELALAFIDDAHIIDGQWHWVEEARAAMTAAQSASEDKGN